MKKILGTLVLAVLLISTTAERPPNADAMHSHRGHLGTSEFL